MGLGRFVQQLKLASVPNALQENLAHLLFPLKFRGFLINCFPVF